MEVNSTSTPNGDSQREVVRGANQGEELKIVILPSVDCYTAVAVVNLVPSPVKTIESGAILGNEEPTLIATGAAELRGDGVKVIIDSSGRITTPETVEEDKSRQAARIKQETEQSAREKYHQNNESSSR